MRVCTTRCPVEKSNTMGRRLQRRVVAIAVLLVLLPLPPPVALSAPLSPGAATALKPLIKYFSSRIQTRKIVKSLFKLLLKYEGKKILKNLEKLLEAKNKSGQHEEEKSADSAGLLKFNLSVSWPSPQNVTGVLDITSELVWTQCAPCSQCPEPPALTFQPNRSDTFASIPCGSDTCQQNVPGQTCGKHSSDPCDYIAVYDDDTNTTGHLANDTFTFGDTPVPGLVFGCSSAALGDFSGASGVFGFNRGPLSVVSQLQLSWFSYHWASDDSSGTSSDSKIQFGGGAAPPTQNNRSTYLLTSHVYPDMYFVKLTGIRVDGKDLDAIPARTFDFKPDGSGGVLLSTTVPVTYLEQPAYDVVKNAIITKITAAQPVNGSVVGLDLCYTIESLKKVTVPTLALVFAGVDAVMDLNRYNYFFSDSDSGLDCLTILPSLGGSILGSLVQKGTTMTYDIAGQQLIFEKSAASLAHSMSSLTMMLPYYLAVRAMLF